MQYVYLVAIVGLCLFNLWSYRRGLKDGLALNQGKPVEPIKSPVAAFTEYREQRTEKKEVKAANDLLSEGMANVFAYDGNPQKKAGEK